MSKKASTKATSKRGPTTAELAKRMDGMEGLIGQIAQAVGAGGEAEAKQAEGTPAQASEAQPTRTVKLPELQRFTDAKRAMGVDATYTSNIALFKLNSDGVPVTKKDGSLRKPTRIRVEDARFLLAHAAEVGALCDQIEANQQPAS